METRKFVGKLSLIASWIGVVATIFAVTSFYTFFQRNKATEMVYNAISQREIAKNIEIVIMKSQNSIEKLKLEIEEISAKTSLQIEVLKEQQQRLLLLASTQNLDPNSQKKFIALITEKVSSKISKSTDLKKMETRIKLIEDVIVQNPEKALQIPFIKSDVAGILKSIESIQETLKSVDDSLDEIKVYKSQVESLTNQVNQTNNWMIGIFGALGVSVLGLLIGNVFRKNKAQS